MQRADAPGRSRVRRARDHLGEVLFNSVVTHLPGHRLRQWFLRRCGATIGRRCSILRGTTVLFPPGLAMGDHCSIGFRCMLDARPGLRLGDSVVMASDTHVIGGYHRIDDPAFTPVIEPVTIGDHAWIASRATILSGVTLGRGAVVSACAVVIADVPDLAVVVGVPARQVSQRDPAALQYRPDFRPPFY